MRVSRHAGSWLISVVRREGIQTGRKVDWERTEYWSGGVWKWKLQGGKYIYNGENKRSGGVRQSGEGGVS